MALLVTLAASRPGFTASLQALAHAWAKMLPDIVFVQTPAVQPGELEDRFPKGSRLARLETRPAHRVVEDLSPGFFAAADPAVSFDGTKIFFSGQKSAHARWQIWEMLADGSDLRQITQCSANCLGPVLLPRGRIAFTKIVGRDSRRSSAVYVSREDGADAHPITFGPGNFQVETVLRNGRLVVSADDPLFPHGLAEGSRALYTINPDGSELRLLRRFRHRGLSRTDAEELDNGAVLFVERPVATGRKGDSQLAWIRRGRLHSSVLTPSQAVYWSAHEFGSDSLLAATQDPSGATDDRKLDLYTFNLADKALGELIYRDPKLSSLQAVPLAPEPVPRTYWSILHPAMITGRILCLNAYLSADVPDGRFTTPIAKVRIITLDQPKDRERTLGDAPVEKDGSFYLRVPADRPIRFELLGANGNVIHAQRSWIWARPGEDRACLGCHEDPALTPADHWPLAARRNSGPTPVGLPILPQPAH